MTSTVLASDTYGVDAAGFAHLASFANVRAAGYEFVSLYVGGNFGVNRTVVERAWAAGLQVQLNYERSATAGLGGAALGAFQAREGIQQSLDLGWMKESPLVWSPVDFSIQASQFDVVDAYHQALVDVCHSEGVIGGSYGPPFYLRHLAAQPWWPDDFVLWQWAGAGWIEPWTWAKQVFAPTHDVSHIGVSVDENVLIREYRFWSGYGPDKDIPPPAVQGDRVMANFIGCVNVVGGDYGALVFGSDGQYYRYDYHPGSVFFAFPRGTINVADYQSLPVWNPSADAYWVADRLKERYPNVDAVGSGTGASANDVADELSRRLSRDA